MSYGTPITLNEVDVALSNPNYFFESPLARLYLEFLRGEVRRLQEISKTAVENYAKYVKEISTAAVENTRLITREAEAREMLIDCEGGNDRSESECIICGENLQYRSKKDTRYSETSKGEEFYGHASDCKLKKWLEKK